VNRWYDLCREGNLSRVTIDRGNQCLKRVDAIVARGIQQRLLEAQSQSSQDLVRTNQEIAQANQTLVATNIKLQSATESIQRNAAIVSLTQRKIEWVELFLITVYALHLAEIVAHKLHFSEVYSSVSVVALPLAAALLAFFLLRPDHCEQHAAEELEALQKGFAGTGSTRQICTMWLLFVLSAAWIAAGLALRRAGHAEGGSGHEGSAEEVESEAVKDH
jgi:hypothetical protein